MNVIDVLYEDQRNYVVSQFDEFHRRIEMLKELEVENLTRFKDFFKGKFLELESKITELVDEKSEGKHLII